MKKALIITLLYCFVAPLSFSQEKPKLVVGIVVDQMRYDYIYRFWDDFGKDGFKRLVNEGHFFRNTNFSERYYLQYIQRFYNSISLENKKRNL